MEADSLGLNDWDPIRAYVHGVMDQNHDYKYDGTCYIMINGEWVTISSARRFYGSLHDIP